MAPQVHSSGGDGLPTERAALDDLFSAAYEELRRLASAVRRSDIGTTRSATTLVNEAWVKLASSPRFTAVSHLHFKRIAARAMRQVLIEAARRRHASKRGGRDAQFVTLDESAFGVSSGGAEEILALETALAALAQVSPRQAEMVECRFFGGLDVVETAAALEVSEATVQRDWRAAKAWLAKELRKSR
jgi:RNA polymerase sigma factor (TIGR02999 family)